MYGRRRRFFYSHRMKSFLSYALAVALAALLAAGAWFRSRSAKSSAWHQYQGFAFNTPCVIMLYGKPGDCGNAAAECLALLSRMDAALNRFDAESEVSGFNRSASGVAFPCSVELWQAFAAAEEAYAATGGAFDVTIGPLIDYWRRVPGVPPADDGQLRELRERCGFGRLSLDHGRRTVCKHADGMSVDFGGIAKGLALDLLRQLAGRKPLDAVFFNLGGNFVYQGPPDLAPFEAAAIASPVPRGDDGDAGRGVPLLQVVRDWHGRCFSTSSNASRPLRKNADGSIVSHIIDPVSGQPVARYFTSVTAISASGALSDAFSTAVFASGMELAQKLVKEHPGTAFIMQKADDGAVITLE